MTTEHGSGELTILILHQFYRKLMELIIEGTDFGILGTYMVVETRSQGYNYFC